MVTSFLKAALTVRDMGGIIKADLPAGAIYIIKYYINKSMQSTLN